MQKLIIQRMSVVTIVVVMPVMLAGLYGRAQSSAKPTTDAATLAKAREKGNKRRAEKKFYTAEFDLSGLPQYRPEQKVSGVIRQWGNNYIKDSGLVQVWEEGFRKFHPDIRFADNLTSTAVAMPALITGVTDLAPMGRQAIWGELKGFEREGAESGNEGSSNGPLEIVVNTGSFDVRGWSFALGVFVHKSNPITKLTVDELDGIFGAERSGGWKGLNWDASVARGPEKNIRTWGQLGLQGEWAEKPIHVYGYNLHYHFGDEFDKKVLKGSGKWNEKLRMYSNIAGLKADGSLTGAGELMMNDLSEDPYGIAYTGMPFATPQTKPVALAVRNGGRYVELALDHVQSRTYPLTRDVYYYVSREPGKPLPPRLKEFLRYVLSREGQTAVMHDGKYLPLTAEAASEQLKKLE